MSIFSVSRISVTSMVLLAVIAVPVNAIWNQSGSVLLEVIR